MREGAPGEGPVFRIVDRPIDIGGILAALSGPDAGAMAVFIGTVRGENAGRRVTALQYQAYPEMAERVMAEIGREIAERHGPCRVAMVHRTGRLDIGETAVVVAVCAPHRREALEGCRYGIERLKAAAPIWKKEYYEDGAAWVAGCPLEGGGR